MTYVLLTLAVVAISILAFREFSGRTPSVSYHTLLVKLALLALLIIALRMGFDPTLLTGR